MYLLAPLWLLRAATAAPAPTPGKEGDDREAGQATAEYALVLLGAAAIALLVVSWTTKTNLVGKLLDAIFGQLLHRVTASR